MSFGTFREFEESLKASRERRRIPNINKTALRRVIMSTESQNRNQEEQEMWMKHFASKRSAERRSYSSENSEDRKPAKKRKKKRKKREKFRAERDDEDENSRCTLNLEHCPRKASKLQIESPKNTPSVPDIGPSVGEFSVSKNLKWGHDGYHELYKDEIYPFSEDEQVETVKKVKKSKKRKKKKEKWVEKDEVYSSDLSDGKLNRKRNEKEDK